MPSIRANPAKMRLLYPRPSPVSAKGVCLAFLAHQWVGGKEDNLAEIKVEIESHDVKGGELTTEGVNPRLPHHLRNQRSK